MATKTITSHLNLRIAGGRFQQTLLDHLREVEAQGARVNAGPTQKKNVALLHSLREAINGLSVDSLTLGRLILVQRHTTGGEDYKPGRAQRRFLSQLGPSAATPGSAALLDELELAAVQDLIAAMNDRVRAAREKVEAETRQAVRAKYENEATRNQAAADKAIGKAAELEARVAKLTGENDFLRGRLDNGAEPERREPEPERYRRKHFDGDPSGVFRTERADGTVVYEVKVGDSGWRTFDSRDEAIAKRNELVDGGEKKPDQPKRETPKPAPTGGNLNPAEVNF